jgi:predicted MPP superfamily phosphohydrolase
MARQSPEWQRYLYAIYWLISAACFGVILAAQVTDWHLWPKAFRTYSFAMVFIFFVSKLFIDVFLLADDLLRVVRFLVLKGQSAFGAVAGGTGARGISRSTFLVRAGLLMGAVPFFSLVYGMISGATNFRIHRVKLRHPGLPSAFDGFRIVQVSDIHTGSFHNGEALHRAARMVNDLKGDVVFFTGDLVNNRHEEALPYVDTLRSIRAPHGVFSIFGNHDYGDYVHWPSPEAKAANLEQLKDLQAALGWRLLIDEHAYIEKDGSKMGVIGVQNWSGRANFQRYGDLQKALKGFQPGAFNVLLSHDPSHWDAQVRSQHPDIHLTLSGHTHGMQFGVEVPGFKWSPAQYFYKEWAGLYRAPGQQLYVNRGLGYIGYPGRVGILPEITLIELQST